MRLVSLLVFGDSGLARYTAVHGNVDAGNPRDFV